MWWQILAYAVLTCGEILVSITGLEYSYKQAPLKAKSFIMALFLLAVTVGNLATGVVNDVMVRRLDASAIDVGTETWVHVANASALVPGQKIDFTKSNIQVLGTEGKTEPLEGTFLIKTVDGAGGRVQLADAVTREPIQTSGTFDATNAKVSTYALVGPAYFMFFFWVMIGGAIVFIVVAMLVREATYVRTDEPGEEPAPA
jgi:POT family proton-dependent oligopeptide transporter